MALAVYGATADFPRQESYGLTSQMRRAAVSIPANIAEGCGKDSVPDFLRHLQIARGSTTELEYHLLLARDLNLLPGETYDHLATDVIDIARMLTALIQKNRPAAITGPKTLAP